MRFIVIAFSWCTALISNYPECSFSDVLLRETLSRKVNASSEAPRRTGRSANAAYTSNTPTTQGAALQRQSQGEIGLQVHVFGVACCMGI